MRKLRNKLVALVGLIVSTFMITTNSYADMAQPITTPSGNDLLIIIPIVVVVCVFAFIILKVVRKK